MGARRKYRKIQVMRQSHLPVKLSNLELFKNEFRTRFDDIMKEVKGDMQAAQNLIGEMELELQEKYPCLENWEWERSQSNWKKLVTEYGPIAMVQNQEGKLMFVIMDQL